MLAKLLPAFAAILTVNFHLHFALDCPKMATHVQHFPSHGLACVRTGLGVFTFNPPDKKFNCIFQLWSPQQFCTSFKCLPTIFYTIKNWRQIMEHLIRPPPCNKMGQLQKLHPLRKNGNLIKKRLMLKKIPRALGVC